MKKMLSAVLLMCMLFSLSGCFPSEKRSNAPDNSVGADNPEGTIADVESGSGEVPTHIEDSEKESIIFDADVNASKVQGLKSISASARKFDAEKIREAILADEEITDTNEFEDGTFPGYMNKVYTTANGANLLITGGGIDYWHAEYVSKEYTNVIFGSKSYPRDDLEKVFTQKTLENLTPEATAQDVEVKLHEMGFTEFTRIKAIALDYETLAKEGDFEDIKRPENKKAIEKFTEADEGYLLVYTGKYNGLEITDTGYSDYNNGMACIGSRIYAVVTAAGLIHLRCEGMYDLQDIEGAQEICG